MSTVATPVRPASRSGRLWAVIAIVLFGFNLRPAVIALAPLLDEISAAIHLSAFTAGALITLPVLCFGVLGPLSPVLARRWGMERTLAGVLAAICVGSALRLIPSVGALFVGTGLIGAGIAIGNILLIGLIKRDFPDHLGLMSGLYTMSLAGGATLAAGITIPVARAAGLDWNLALGAWGLFALLALIVWLPLLRGGARRVIRAGVSAIRLRQEPVAWLVTAFLGLQSLNFYAIQAWLPTILIAHGYDALVAGWMLSLTNLVSILPALVAPILIGRMRSQSLFAFELTALYAIATVGLIVAMDAAVLWVVILGVAQGATLGLALTLIVLRSPDAQVATRLSGMSQSWGYGLAAAGPLLLGSIYDLSLTWTVPLLLLLALLLPQAVTGYLAGRPRLIGAGRANAVAGGLD